MFNGTYVTYCQHKPCSPCFYEVFKMSNLTWDSNVGFHCIKCPLKFIKPNSGIHKSTECDGYFVSNEERTECVDPLQITYITINRISGRTALAISLIGGINTLLVLIVFILKSKTPIVRATDYKLTFIQIVVCFGIFLSLPIVYLGKLSFYKFYSFW